MNKQESLWAGEFGTSYIERNRQYSGRLDGFWQNVYDVIHPANVLEVGCNAGLNLKSLARFIPQDQLYGVDVNQQALGMAQTDVPGITTVCCRGRNLPFRDAWFDLVFTVGVLIHQPSDTLPLMMSEVVRCSRRYVLCAEYRSDQSESVPYHGHTDALFRRDYGAIYRELFPELTLISEGPVEHDQPTEDLYCWIFEK